MENENQTNIVPVIVTTTVTTTTTTSAFTVAAVEVDVNVEDNIIVYIISVSLILGILTCLTIIGNVFVIAAIIMERNLRTTANYLVLSLAVADLMVACFVMPLGAVSEIRQQWSLGTLLCDVWTSADVLCCTASILHLLAIALDRYWAVTYVDYIHKRTPQRICWMIFAVWTVAAIVSIPPILGWKDPYFNVRVEQEKRCLISQDIGYQVFATISTFYGPLIFILLLYWKIYQVARKRIRHKPGKTITPASATVNPKMMIHIDDDEIVTKKFSFKKRIFSLPQKLPSTSMEKDLSNQVLRNNTNNNNNNNNNSDDRIESMEFSHEKGHCNLDDDDDMMNKDELKQQQQQQQQLRHIELHCTNDSNEGYHDSCDDSYIGDNNNNIENLCLVDLNASTLMNQNVQHHYINNNHINNNVKNNNKKDSFTNSNNSDLKHGNHRRHLSSSSTSSSSSSSIDENTIIIADSNEVQCLKKNSTSTPPSKSLTITCNSDIDYSGLNDISPTTVQQSIHITTPATTTTIENETNHKNAQKNLQMNQLQLRKAIKESIESKRERKAAKILAIITGIFVICWLPFFVMALVMPLCKNCQPSKYTFSIFLWLGYCNSLLNPIIYTIFSPDFRNGFRRILCGIKRRQR
ncbi:5-hydroxytryptamine receptor-like [Dermatophagoides pteronyssinus]|uniref:5-hydroxytryptamine receptor-like n=1 Tax=Dermatophagoides pteronyssinus TaxID=6956 RepID=UPI003F67905B